MKIAVIGCGRIADRHLDAIVKTDGLEVGGVCDVKRERWQPFADKYGVPGYDSIDDLLTHGELDAAAICTPSGMHPDHGIQIARAGKHVITEKPMAVNVKNADRLIHACDDAGVNLMVVKQNRLNPPIQLLHRAVMKNRFGRMFMGNATVRWTRPQSYYDQDKWRGTWEFDGGAFMNQASHYIDMLLWFLGPVDSVMAKTATLDRRIETEDTGAALLQFRNGAIGVVEVTVLTYPRNFEGSLTIVGEKGTVKIGGFAVNKIEHWQFKDYDDDDKDLDWAATKPPDVYGFGHVGYYANVAKVLLGEAAPDLDGREGRRSLEVIQAIYLSAKERRQVALPLLD